MFERFSPTARAAVVEAQEQARILGDAIITADHLLLGVLGSGDNAAVRVLTRHGIERDAVASRVQRLGLADNQALAAIGVDLEAVRDRAEASFGAGALDRPRQRRGLLNRRGGHIPFDTSAKDALTQSLRETLALEEKTIGVEHLLLALLAGNTGVAARTISGLGVDPGRVRSELLRELGQGA